MCPIQQSVTYRYWEFPVPGIFHIFGGIGTDIGTNWYQEKVSELVPQKFGTGKKSQNRYRKVWYQKKVSEPVSDNFDTRTDFRRQHLGILKIYNGYQYQKFLIFSGGIGTGIEKIWYWKKSLGTDIEKIWYR